MTLNLCSVATNVQNYSGANNLFIGFTYHMMQESKIKHWNCHFSFNTVAKFLVSSMKCDYSLSSWDLLTYDFSTSSIFINRV